MKWQHILAIFTLSFPFQGKANELHITETSPCKALITEYESLPDYNRKEFIEKKDSVASAAIEKYTAMKNENFLSQAKQFKSCVQFLKKFSNYVDSLKNTKPVLDAINPSEAPDFASSDKIQSKNQYFFVRELTKEQAWQLLECKPCQEVRKLCQDDEGLFDETKAKKLQENVGHLYNRSLETTTIDKKVYINWLGNFLGYKETKISTPIPQDELIPLPVHAKALLIEKCLEIITQKQNSDMQDIEKYFNNVNEATNEQ